MTLEELRQLHEDNLDYLIEKIEDNPVDIEVYHYYITQSNQINARFAEEMIGDLIKGEDK